MRTLRTSDRNPLDILADVRHVLTDNQRTFWRTSDGHSADVRRTFWRTSDGHSADVRIKFQRMWSIGTECPTDVRCFHRMSDRNSSGRPLSFSDNFFCLLVDVADIVFQYSAWTSVRCPQGILAENSCNGGHLGYGLAAAHQAFLSHGQSILAVQAFL